MKKTILIILMFVSLCASAQNKLKFNKDGSFKIVQFTDTHYIYNDTNAIMALENMKAILEYEKPDLVVFTGDIIFGKPAYESFDAVLSVVENAKTPFAITFGNHDHELGPSNADLYLMSKKFKYNVTDNYDKNPDYVLEIAGSDNNNKCAALIYCLESNAYSQIKGIGYYAWFDYPQIDWYRATSNKYKQKYGNLSALAFFHIPLPELDYAISHSCPCVGTRLEKSCGPDLNTGMFGAMKVQGDIMGIFTGHDHDNDIATMYYDILLAEGRYSGGNTVYNNIPRGARVIELIEGERSFKTWIRLQDGFKFNEVTFPKSFIQTGL